VLSGEGKNDVFENRLMEAAAVLVASKQQVRASPRLQRSKDEHILAKAEERAARKNLEFIGGNLCSNSLLSIIKRML
jgi:hypothetical protein